MQVQAEMQRLVPAQTAWKVEKMDKNMFKTVFPMKGEMHRMIEWASSIKAKQLAYRSSCPWPPPSWVPSPLS
jgi:hypothetical protein